LLLLAGLFALFAGLSAGGHSTVFADSCDSEETAVEECTFDEFGTPAAGPGGPEERTAPPDQGFGTSPSIAPVPIPRPRPTLRIWTDRKSYYLGDTLQVCFRVPAPGNIQIIDLMPDGTRHTLWAWYDDGRGDCMLAYVTPPTGTECLLLRYEDSRIYFAPQGGWGIAPAAAPIEGIRPSPRFLYAKTCFQTWGDWAPIPYPVDFPPPPPAS
jgi:hypothetical protein